MDESSRDIQIELLNAKIDKLEADVQSERSERKAINRLLEDREEEA